MSGHLLRRVLDRVARLLVGLVKVPVPLLAFRKRYSRSGKGSSTGINHSSFASLRAANDIFSGADLLIVATSVRASNLVPSPGHYHEPVRPDASRSEACGGLAAGRSLKDAAGECRITIKSARTYLERISGKRELRSRAWGHDGSVENHGR